jgi:hypothetical protein
MGNIEGERLTTRPAGKVGNPTEGWIPSKPATPVTDPSPTTDAGKKKVVAGIVAVVVFAVGQIIDLPVAIEIGKATVTLADILTAASLFVMGLFSVKQAKASADAED